MSLSFSNVSLGHSIYRKSFMTIVLPVVCLFDFFNACLGKGYIVQSHIQQYLSYIVAVSFIGDCGKSLTNSMHFCHVS